MKNELMVFEGHEVEVLELDGQVLFNPKHVAGILGIKNVNDNISKMNDKQFIKLTNSDIGLSDIRKLNNAGENFLTESGVYKLVFKSRKPNAEAFTDWIADEVLPALRKAGSYEMPGKKKDANRLPLPSVNTMVKNVKDSLKGAGVDDLYIAAEIKRIYTDAGYPVSVPLITDKEIMPKLYDCTEMAKELSILSSSGIPHNKAVSAVISKIEIDESEIVTTAFARNGHEDVTTQYKPSVRNKVKQWLADNDYPVKIPYTDSKGNYKTYTVFYQDIKTQENVLN